jgi:hypothetical protein
LLLLLFALVICCSQFNFHLLSFSYFQLFQIFLIPFLVKKMVRAPSCSSEKHLDWYHWPVKQLKQGVTTMWLRLNWLWIISSGCFSLKAPTQHNRASVVSILTNLWPEESQVQTPAQGSLLFLKSLHRP